MQKKVLIGKIVKAQGIKGEVKVMPITSDIQRFKKINYCFINNIKYTITHVRIGADNFAYLTFSEITDRNAAELLIHIHRLYLLLRGCHKQNRHPVRLLDKRYEWPCCRGR